jgi:hypothetical protein
MELVKVNDTTFRPAHSGLKITIPCIASPFGPELYMGVTYLNLEIDNSKSHHSQLLGDLYKAEDAMQAALAAQVSQPVEWCTSIRKKQGMKPLWKVRIPKRQAKSGTSFQVDTSIGPDLCTWNELMTHTDQLKKDFAVEVTLQSVWRRGSQAGAVWCVTKIVG